MGVIEDYKAHTVERDKLGVPPLPLTAAQTAELVQLLQQDPIPAPEYVLELFENHISPGVDDAASVKAGFLKDIISGAASSAVITKLKAVQILGTMLGGYNVAPLIEALSNADAAVAAEAAEQLKNTLLVYESFDDVETLMDEGNEYAKSVIESWADAEWFQNREPVSEELI